MLTLTTSRHFGAKMSRRILRLDTVGMGQDRPSGWDGVTW
jgi:hypothetical protein